MLADSTVVSGTRPFFEPPITSLQPPTSAAAPAAAVAAATRALMMNPASWAAAAPFLYGNNALR